MSTNGRGKSLLAKFAKLNLQENLRRYPPVLGDHDGPWLTQRKLEQHNAQQLAYAEPYQAEYQPSTSSHSDRGQDDHSDLSAEDHRMRDIADLADELCTNASKSDIMSSLVRIRSKKRVQLPIEPTPSESNSQAPPRRQAPRATTSASSILDFERTSTVLPPPTDSIPEEGLAERLDDYKMTYFSRPQQNTSLSIHKYKTHIVDSVNAYSITLIEGATGCGKTTQVPVYLLEDSIMHNEMDRIPLIYVTQPRRIAAKSIALRVCAENRWELGDLVGYQVGMNKVAGPNTVLVFCTAGVLLQKLISEKSLKSFSHIIVDEAHERDADSDLLLMLIRTLMRREQLTFRLVVMSATMDMTKLKTYFTFKTNYSIITPAICRVENEKKLTNIQIVYFDKLRYNFQIKEQMPKFDIEQPELHEECLQAAVKIIIDVIPHLDTFSDLTKSTLVFLPGLAEINKLHRMLRCGEKYLDIIPLHSCLAYSDQLGVFEPARSGYRKVILATNIAESSITVPDVGFVIDFCLSKVLMKDEVTRFPTLKLQWSTHDKSTQRAGRTGRCCPGKVFRMVSANFYREFSTYSLPELLIAPLELSVLRIKNFQLGEVKALLAVVLDPPPFNEIRTAVLELKQIGALTAKYEGKLSDIDGDLTELGKVIVSLPIDVHLSKLIVIASAFDVIEDAIVIAACLSTNRSVVKHIYGNQLESYNNKLAWANGSYSDLFVSLDAYKEYLGYKDIERKSQAWLEKYCNQKRLDDRKLFEVSALVDEIKLRLEQMGTLIIDQPNREKNRYEDEFMLKIAICSAFYPNYFLSREFDLEIVKRGVCGFDPTKTVILHNLPVNQVPLYYSQIMGQLRGVIGDNVEFLADVSRALLVIHSDENMLEDESTVKATGLSDIIHLTHGVSKAVYLAIKLGDAERLQLREYWEPAAYNRMQHYNEARRQFLIRNRLPPPWLRVVSHRPADNSRLLEANDEEYERITRCNYYIEVDLNDEQDSEDSREISRIDLAERGSGDVHESEIFKKEIKRIRGPTSPIQITFEPVLFKSIGYNVSIDNSSVNSILLDPRYEEKEKQLLVAASVSQARGRLTVRDTTLMPKINGLTELLALLFAPERRLSVDDVTKVLYEAVFGLGWDEGGKPLDKDYVVDTGLSVKIDTDDLDLIDQARSYIIRLIESLAIKNTGAPRGENQTNLRRIILTLIRKRRSPVDQDDK